MGYISLIPLECLLTQIQQQPKRMLDGNLLIEDMQKYKFQFGFIYNNVAADALVFLHVTPYILAIATRDTNFYFEFELTKNFGVLPIMPPKLYKDFLLAFQVKYDPNHKFTPRDFWTFFLSNIPSSITNTKYVNFKTIVKRNPNIEERNALKFIRFLPHGASGHKVTEKNLDKTRRLLGEQAYVRCKSENISTCWSI